MLALRDLDTGLFFKDGRWILDPKYAEEFADRESIEKVVFKLDIKNAEVVFLDRDGRVVGGEVIRLSP